MQYSYAQSCRRDNPCESIISAPKQAAKACSPRVQQERPRTLRQWCPDPTNSLRAATM
jgi:hypothetical protein